MELMVRLSKGDIDYLIIKDLKRLSRSTEVSAQIRSACKKYNFKLILLENGRIYDPLADESSRLLYGFESLLAEEVVFRQSTYGKIAHKQKMEALRLNQNNVTFGYRWNEITKDIEIDETQAEVIRQLYEKVIFEDMGMLELRKWLHSIGTKVCVTTIRRWLHETAYIGIFNMNKKGSELGVGAGQKTRYFTIPQEEWVHVERNDLRILEPEIFDLVQRVMKSRKTTYNNKEYEHARFHGLHLFSSKVFCKECGCPYVHSWIDRKKTVSAYKQDARRAREGVQCANENYRKIYQEDLERITLLAINGFLSEHESCFEVLLNTIEKTLTAEIGKNKNQQRLEKQIQKSEKEAEKVLESYLETSGALKLALAEKYEKIMQEVEELKSHRVVDEDAEKNREELISRINDIKNHIGKMKHVDVLDRETILRFIKRIEIDKDGNVEVHLNVDSMYQAQIEVWQKRKQSQSNEAAVFDS